MSSNEKTEEKKVRLQALKKLGIVCIALIFIINTVQLVQLNAVVQSIKGSSTGFIDEVGFFRDNIRQFGEDLNEVRSYLFLPTRDYSFIDESALEAQGEEDGDAKQNSPMQEALYSFLTQYSSEKEREKNIVLARERMQNLTTGTDFLEQLKSAQLTFATPEENNENHMVKVVKDNEPLFNLIIDKSFDTLHIQSALGSETIKGGNKEAIQYILDHKDQAHQLKQALANSRQVVEDISKSEQIQTILQQRNIVREQIPQEDERSINYIFHTSEGTPVLTVSIVRSSTSFQLNNNEYSDSNELQSALAKELQAVDTATELEKTIRQNKAELEQVFTEEAFTELLAGQGLKVNPQPREEYNKIIYDVTNNEGKVVFSFVIELSSGLFKLLQDNREIDLGTQLDGSKKNF